MYFINLDQKLFLLFLVNRLDQDYGSYKKSQYNYYSQSKNDNTNSGSYSRSTPGKFDDQISIFI